MTVQVAQTFLALLDEYGNTIPILPVDDLHEQLSIGTGSSRVALPASGVLFRVAAQIDCWVRFGGSDVVAAAGDMLFLAGTEVIRPPADATYIAVISFDTSTGTMGITRIGGGDE